MWFFRAAKKSNLILLLRDVLVELHLQPLDKLLPRVQLLVERDHPLLVLRVLVPQVGHRAVRVADVRRRLLDLLPEDENLGVQGPVDLLAAARRLAPRSPAAAAPCGARRRVGGGVAGLVARVTVISAESTVAEALVGGLQQSGFVLAQLKRDSLEYSPFVHFLVLAGLFSRHFSTTRIGLRLMHALEMPAFEILHGAMNKRTA